MEKRRKHFRGQLQTPGGRPQNVELFLYEVNAARLVETFTDGDTTPSVKTNEESQTYKTANTSATTISDFDDGYIGQTVHVIIGDANTTIDFTSSGLRGNGGADWTPAANDSMTCFYDGTDWFCSIRAEEPATGTTIGDVANFDVTDVEVGANAEGSIKVDSDGDIYRQQGVGGSYISQDTWQGNGAAADYEVKATVLSGDAPTTSAGLGSWLACSTDRTWSWLRTVSGTYQTTFQIEYRRTSDNLTLAATVHDVTITRS